MKVIIFALACLFILFCGWGLSPTKPEPELLYRVCWQSSVTGTMGFGQPMSKETAMAWVNYGNNLYPDITHSVVLAE